MFWCVLFVGEYILVQTTWCLTLPTLPLHLNEATIFCILVILNDVYVGLRLLHLMWINLIPKHLGSGNYWCVVFCLVNWCSSIYFILWSQEKVESCEPRFFSKHWLPGWLASSEEALCAKWRKIVMWNSCFLLKRTALYCRLCMLIYAYHFPSFSSFCRIHNIRVSLDIPCYNLILSFSWNYWLCSE